jgi:hypothetical protein
MYWRCHATWHAHTPCWHHVMRWHIWGQAPACWVLRVLLLLRMLLRVLLLLLHERRRMRHVSMMHHSRWTYHGLMSHFVTSPATEVARTSLHVGRGRTRLAHHGRHKPRRVEKHPLGRWGGSSPWQRRKPGSPRMRLRRRSGAMVHWRRTMGAVPRRLSSGARLLVLLRERQRSEGVVQGGSSGGATRTGPTAGRSRRLRGSRGRAAAAAVATARHKSPAATWGGRRAGDRGMVLSRAFDCGEKSSMKHCLVKIALGGIKYLDVTLAHAFFVTSEHGISVFIGRDLQESFACRPSIGTAREYDAPSASDGMHGVDEGEHVVCDCREGEPSQTENDAG